ncbi:protein tyrosine phosphatase [Roseateles sp. YR242]|nr:protein tyrosine phosphatase [Roseateles sp. YR242]
MAEAVLQARAAALGLRVVASAGVWASPRGQAADKRAQQVLSQRGYGLDRRWRSRRVCTDDFDQHDLMLAMDHDVLRGLQAIRPARSSARLGLFLHGMTGLGRDEVPDPYYGTVEGFQRVLDLIEARVQAWPDTTALERYFPVR